MAAMTPMPRGREFTRADLDAMPDDGNRYELFDGALIVSPAPIWRHQLAVGELYYLLRHVRPAGLDVLTAPFDVVLSERRVLEPDLLVARRDAFSATDLPAAPLLAVEVLSPSTQLIDRNLKKAAFEEAGCPAFWIVDAAEPSITAWNLADGRYVQVAHCTGEDLFETDQPFPVSFTPAQLVR